MPHGIRHEDEKIRQCFLRGVKAMDEIIAEVSKTYPTDLDGGGDFPRQIIKVAELGITVAHRPQWTTHGSRLGGNWNGKSSIEVRLRNGGKGTLFREKKGVLDVAAVVLFVKSLVAMTRGARDGRRSREERRKAIVTDVASRLRAIGLSGEPGVYRDVIVEEDGEIRLSLRHLTPGQMQSIVTAAVGVDYVFREARDSQEKV
jgi:hypothetical protein